MGQVDIPERPGADQAHVTLEDVPELGELVHAHPPKKPSEDRNEPGVVPQLNVTGPLLQCLGVLLQMCVEVRLSIRVHRSQFPHTELLAVQSIPLLPEEGRSGAHELDGERRPGEDRQRDKKECDGHDVIRDPLDNLIARNMEILPQLERQKAAEVARFDPKAWEFGEVRHHDDPGKGKVLGELPEADRPALRGGQDDRIDLILESACLRNAAQNRKIRDVGDAVGVVAQEADRHEAELGLIAQNAGDYRPFLSGPGQQDRHAPEVFADQIAAPQKFKEWRKHKSEGEGRQ